MKGPDWTPEQIQLLIDHYPSEKTSDLVELIGRDINSIYSKAYGLKISKSPEFLASDRSGRLNVKPIGTEYVDNRGYLVRKINNDFPLTRRWKHTHLVEWEKHHGPVPAGFQVHMKDGNKKNISIENLELITRKENLERNSINRYPVEIANLIRLQRKLEKTIKERK